MSETFTFDVNDITFKQIESLRSLMLGFVQIERRDFRLSFNIVAVGTSQADNLNSHIMLAYTRVSGKRAP